MLSRVACFSIPKPSSRGPGCACSAISNGSRPSNLDQVVTALRRVASDGAIFPLRLAPGSVVVELAQQSRRAGPAVEHAPIR